MNDDSPIMLVPAAARYLNRSEDFVRRVVRYECPVVQRGKRGKLGFFKRDLDRWLAQNTKVPANG